MESVQASLENEQRAKVEILRIKKKLEYNINEFEIDLDHANKSKNEISEKANLSDRRANGLQEKVEEATALLHSDERAKRRTEAEVGVACNASL